MKIQNYFKQTLCKFKKMSFSTVQSRKRPGVRSTKLRITNFSDYSLRPYHNKTVFILQLFYEKLQLNFVSDRSERGERKRIV